MGYTPPGQYTQSQEKPLTTKERETLDRAIFRGQIQKAEAETAQIVKCFVLNCENKAKRPILFINGKKQIEKVYVCDECFKLW